MVCDLYHAHLQQQLYCMLHEEEDTCMSYGEEEACDLYHAHVQQQLHSADDQERAVITHLPESSLPFH
jgi:hypothetical protein